MPDVREFQPVVESAEKAAAAGDFVAAEQLLREAADLQEASLGPMHPDLASTFNNLAVACEMAGKPADAEQFYRRAYAIAVSALGPDHPLVATSRDNLRDFCQAHGLPLEVLREAAPGAPPAPVAPVPESVAAVPVPRPVPPAPALRPAAPPVTTPRPPDATASRRFGAALAIVALLATLAVARLWLAGDGDTSAPPTAASTPQAASEAVRAQPVPVPADANAPSSPPASAPLETPAQASVPPRPVAPAPGDPPPTTREPAAASAPSTSAPTAPRIATPLPPTPPRSASAPADVRVVTASVCRTLATGQGPWRCDETSATNAPGRFSYLTRIASPRSVRVRHRWYQGDRLRQDVVLTVGANPSEGYRTFSRQTVSPGEWRVEVQIVDGVVLGETRFVVQ